MAGAGPRGDARFAVPHQKSTRRPAAGSSAVVAACFGWSPRDNAKGERRGNVPTRTVTPLPVITATLVGIEPQP
ncbi:MAG: hypothetical protein ABR608_13920, partial [Pseudonocardiaceae bacterium]